jgi:hypothetical protein
MAPEEIESLPTCSINYSGDFKPEDFRGVRLDAIYKIDADGNASPDQEADSRNAADLFGRLHELPLKKMPPCVSEAYRLTWVPSFHRTTTVRIWGSDDGFFVDTKRLERTAENRNGSVFTETSRKLSLNEWETVRGAVDKFDFWQVASTKNEPIPNDGAAWLLEGMKSGNYHSVFRIGPDVEYERLIRKLFAASGENTEIDLYLSAESLN